MAQDGCLSIWCNPEGCRVELYVLEIAPGLFGVTAVAGKPGNSALRCVQQGPFDGRDLAVGCCRAIGASLAGRGYVAETRDGTRHWELAAHRAARTIQQRRAAFTPDMRFRPEDVLADLTLIRGEPE